MKWPKDQYEIIKFAFSEVIESTGKSAEEIKEAYSDRPGAVLWHIWTQVQYDVMKNNDDPAYTEHGRERRCTYNHLFKLYPPGCNDDHLKTCLRKVGKELGIL